MCGQENIATKESFFSLLRHFVYDILHFDSNFFKTLKYLLFRPGYLSAAYVAGHRAAYINPIRMYLFTSFIFFFLVFSLKDPKSDFLKINRTETKLAPAQRRARAGEVKKALAKDPADTALLADLLRLQDSTRPVKASDLHFRLTVANNEFGSAHSYDSLQRALPPQQRDGWLRRTFIQRILVLKERYTENPLEGLQRFSELFVHKLSYLLFISLPFFALILKLLYARRRTFFYSDHAIFTLHHYIFSFIVLMIVSLLSAFADWSHHKLFQYLIYLLLAGWAVHLYMAMRKFYGQGSGKTFVKFLLLNSLGFFVLLLLFAAFLFFTIFQL